MVSMLSLNVSSHSNTSYGSSAEITATTVSTTSHGNSDGNNNRIWIKQSAIDEARKREQHLLKSANKKLSSTGSVTSSTSASTAATPTARNSSSSNATNYIPRPCPPSIPRVNSINNSAGTGSDGNGTDKNSNQTPFGRRLSGSFSNKNFSSSSICSTSNNSIVCLPGQLLSSSCSTTMDTETSSLCTDVSNQSSRQALTWGWKPGFLVESSGGHVLVRLAQDNNSTLPPTTIKLPADSLTSGDVVLSNEYAVSTETGNLQPPNDLITLTHLHEPAVIESLQHRYAADQIYTNTGPVLLAMNPFQTVRGLYGETIQKKYWEKAERNLPHELPPHVYAIADESFRCMVRALEDSCDGSHHVSANQSILVSGESGAGKTVTTKFVMKYLAALSHRSASLQQLSQKRAYLKAQESTTPSNATIAVSPAHTSNPRFASSAITNKNGTRHSWGGALGGWNGINTNENNANGSSTPKSPQNWVKKSVTRSSSSSSNDLVSTMLPPPRSEGASNNSIEAQVLQSNPILESFGNARTIRNDNSSRFGKFIEIQFTQNGKLVGAQIETYLLEKVRLVTQTSGERNYHIFYELLSGAIDRKELSQYFLAHTACPEDFKITAGSETFDRRDGVSDRETYAQLRQAMKTMNFSIEDISQVFRLTSAIMHASNLTFVDGANDEECELDAKNIHLDPVCHMLGVSEENLNKALCTFTIQAGKSTFITRSLNKEKAAAGLEALLKETYGALFNYLVHCINQSIAYKEENLTLDDSDIDSKQTPNLSGRSCLKPAASIGVLDIFGFESFAKNSFEQLCINYCNEALQQQFNAFVLRNEQAEYEEEGIEWSFIEFPENQDVLDLLDSGNGILRILDDQCRAPGPSDKAFAVNIYQHCSNSTRFIASRKQQATLKFSIRHYAGPVEYTTEGFTEKNKDELPKESNELLSKSSVSFVRELATIMTTAPADSALSSAPTPLKGMLRRVDSSVGRPTVGGQFRKQLKILRNKIDLTTPHYVRCLKPNDMLVPEHFDTAIVAEQLRCGGILEAVRVARAGFTQHYLHADFVRRYRALAWKELSSHSWSNAAPNTPVGSAIGHTRNFRNNKRHSTGSFTSPSFLPSAQKQRNSLGGKIRKVFREDESELSPEDVKAVCKDLIKILYRKIQQIQQEEAEAAANDTSICSDSSDLVVETPPPPVARGKAFSPNTYSVPSWSLKSPSLSAMATPKTKAINTLTVTVASPSNTIAPPTRGSTKSKFASWEEKAENLKKQAPAPTSPPAWKKRAGPVSNSDYVRVGIQVGKTKIFLRHKAFETLERIRSTEQNKAASKLNAVFRRYLARIAYIPYRDAFRRELRERMRMFEHASEHKESKEDDFGDFARACSLGNGSQGHGSSGLGSAISQFCNSNFHAESLVDKWTESQIRDAIRNPVPRHQWGKIAPSDERNFKWVISDDGLWVKNYECIGYEEEEGR